MARLALREKLTPVLHHHSSLGNHQPPSCDASRHISPANYDCGMKSIPPIYQMNGRMRDSFFFIKYHQLEMDESKYFWCRVVKLNETDSGYIWVRYRLFRAVCVSTQAITLQTTRRW